MPCLSTTYPFKIFKGCLPRILLGPFFNICPICEVLRDLVPFVQSKKREKHPWRCVTLSKI